MNEQRIAINFSYGALSLTLEEQAKAQGFTLGDKADFFEGLRKAKTMLMFHILTDSQNKSITEKIHKAVIKALIPLEQMN